MFLLGCASLEATNSNSRAGIKTRGVTSSVASVDRHMKPGRFLTVLFKLTEEQLISAWASINQLEHKLCHLVTVPANRDFEPRFLLLSLRNLFVCPESTNSNRL